MFFNDFVLSNFNEESNEACTETSKVNYFGFGSDPIFRCIINFKNSDVCKSAPLLLKIKGPFFIMPLSLLYDYA